MMSSYIENIFAKLLTPDSNSIKQNKIYSCTLLRKKVKNWKTLRDSEKTQIKNELMNALVAESDESVRKQIMILIATAYKYSLKSSQEWPEVLAFINGLVVSSDETQHVSGVYMLSVMNEEAAEQIKPHYVNILQIFSKILLDLNNLKAAFYVLTSLKAMIPFTTTEELNDLVKLLPYAVNASVRIIKSDQNEEILRSVFDFFQSLIEYDIDISMYVKHLAEFCLEFILDHTLKNPTKVCAMNFLNVLIETQKSHLIKFEMITPIASAIFLVMTQSNEPLKTKTDFEIEMLDDGEENQEDSFMDDSENMFTAATQVLDYCALYFPPKKFIQTLIEHVIPALQSEKELERRAGLAALAITSEGCADFYRQHYLELLTGSFLKGMHDSSPMVVQMAYFCLCQFSEFIQPNVAKFSDKIMQLLFESMEFKTELRSISRLTIRFYDALQSYCENLGEDLVNYLPTLMSKLLTLEVQCNSSVKLQRLIISTFSSIVWSVKSKFNPFFEFAVQIIKPYLSYDQLNIKEHDIKLIQIESIELMGVFAKFIGKEKFTDAYVTSCLTFVQNVLGSETDPEMKSAAFNLLAGLTSRLKENLALKEIMPKLIESLKSEEGINIIDADDNKNDMFSAFDEVDLQDDDDIEEEDEDEEEDEEDGISNLREESPQICIENEFVAQKLAAINCLQELIKYSNPHFIDFYDQSIDELKNLTFFIHHNIKKESFLALANLISYFHDFLMANMNKMNDAQKEKMLKTLNSNINDFYQISLKCTKKEPNREIVMTIYESIKIILARCAPYIKNNLNEFNKQIEVYANMVIDTLDNKAFCQIVDQIVESFDVEENQAEYDYLLKEMAGDIVPSLALCLPENMFDAYFEKVLKFLINTLNKPDATIGEKSFVIGVVGETVANLESLKSARANQLFLEFYKYTQSTEDEIRSNTIYTIGVLCSQSRNTLQEFYSKIINDLLVMIKTEKHKQSQDNICGTLCRLFMCCMSSNSQNINYELILHGIFELTPLKVDINEYFTLYSFILQNATNKQLINFFPKIVEFSGHVLSHNQNELKKGTRELVVQFLKYINQNYKQELDLLVGQMNKEAAQEITLCLSY